MSTFRPVTVRLQASAARTPNAEAVVAGGRRVTYRELWREVCGVAGFLRGRGIGPGDRVAVLLENSPEYIAAYYGALAAGAVAVGLNVSARVREIGCWLEHSGARCLFATARHPDFADLAGHHANRPLVAVGGEAPGAIAWETAAASSPATPSPVGESSPAAILYTSGTTGRPKGVLLTHGNLSANAESIIEYLQLTAADRVLTVLPFFYSYGSSVLHTHLGVGGALVLENSLVYPHRVLSRMADERATGFPGVPSTFALLLQGDGLHRADLSALRYLTQAGGSMPPATIRRLRDALPHARLYVMYGQTEATARLTYLPPERLEDKLGSVGIPIPGVSIQVRCEDGSPAGPRESGEVCAHGPNVMSGYFGDADATARVLRDGWLHTGDLGYLDEDGYLYLEGRRSDMIKSGAHRISPLDIEEVIAVLPEISEVAVVGVADEVLGEAIKAVVTVRPGASIDALSVQRHCQRHLPRYKVPRTVEFATSLPRTSSGKVMRYQLTR